MRFISVNLTHIARPPMHQSNTWALTHIREGFLQHGGKGAKKKKKRKQSGKKLVENQTAIFGSKKGQKWPKMAVFSAPFPYQLSDKEY